MEIHVEQMARLRGTTLIRSATTGWATFVAPFTPGHCFNLPPFDPALDLVSTLLQPIVSPPQGASPPAIVAFHSVVLPLWPSIWIWLQIFHEHKLTQPHGLLSTLDPEILQARYALIFNTLCSFVFSDPQTTLSVAILHTDGVLDMAAALWIEEARDPEAFYGFEMASLLLYPAKGLSPDRNLSMDILDHIVTGCGGRNDDVVQLLHRRIMTNLKQLKPDLQSLRSDFKLILQLLSTDTIICDTIMSNVPYTIASMVDALHHLLLLKLKSTYKTDRQLLPMDLVEWPMVVIFVVLRNPGPYEGYLGLVQLLDSTFFALVGRLARWTPSDDMFCSILKSVLQMVCVRFAVHRPLLSAMKRELAAAFSAGIPGNSIGNVLRGFQSELTGWTQLDEQYRNRQGICDIVCGDPQVCFSICGIF